MTKLQGPRTKQIQNPKSKIENLNPEPRTLNPPEFALLTPPGRGAVATVAVRGADAADAVGRRFTSAAGKSLREFPTGRAVFGRFRAGAAHEEELVIGLVAEGELEIHCHGGNAAVRAIETALVQEGCAAVRPATWVHDSEADPIRAEALLALTEARTERTAAVLLDQYRGALGNELSRIQQLLEREEILAASEAVRALIARADVGLHLTKPWRIVLAGRPNAGKSSLLNALVGYERAIVFSEPGTTRDVLTAATAIDGWPVELADTAGLREAAGELEAEGVARTREQVAQADLVLFVADTTAGWDQPLHLEMSQSARRILVVHNKVDLTPPPEDGRPDGVALSAKTGIGMQELCLAIGQCLAPQAPPAGAAVPFREEQVRGLTATEAGLATGRIEETKRRLAALRTLRNGRTLPGTEY